MPSTVPACARLGDCALNVMPDMGDELDVVGVARRMLLRDVGKGLPLKSGERNEKGLNGSLVGENAALDWAVLRNLLLACPKLGLICNWGGPF